jgi:uncharacterized protein HemX
VSSIEDRTEPDIAPAEEALNEHSWADISFDAPPIDAAFSVRTTGEEPEIQTPWVDPPKPPKAPRGPRPPLRSVLSRFAPAIVAVAMVLVAAIGLTSIDHLHHSVSVRTAQLRQETANDQSVTSLYQWQQRRTAAVFHTLSQVNQRLAVTAAQLQTTEAQLQQAQQQLQELRQDR